DSKSDMFAAGTYVCGVAGGGRGGDYLPHGAAVMEPIGPSPSPPSAYLRAVGVAGMRACTHPLPPREPKSGETVFVSAAAGAVGSVVCQIAKLKGCRVVGSVGSEEKAEWLRREAGVDAVVNYRTCGNLLNAVREACPNGIDIYYENVG